jgi:hypothetical protein
MKKPGNFREKLTKFVFGVMLSADDTKEESPTVRGWTSDETENILPRLFPAAFLFTGFVA